MRTSLPTLQSRPEPHAAVSAPVLAPDAAAMERRAQWPVALVTMPFVSMHRPSIQVGLLTSLARKHGFPATALHLSLDFARQIGPELYELLCRHRGRMFSEWLFSLAAFGDEAPDPADGMMEEFSSEVSSMMGEVNASPERLAEIRRVEVPLYLDRLLDSVPWQDFRVVGFSSTFQQNVASFALAARLKQRFPHLVMVFGGANFEGDMGVEYVRSIGCVDYAVIGEGDEAFPEFLQALADGRDPSEVPGVVRRLGPGAATGLTHRVPFRDLDSLPAPDYADFFDRAEALEILPRSALRQVEIPFESARGCWWGQKNHCTFCGLNGKGLVFRSKSPERVVSEISELARSTRSFRFEAVDNILDYAYLDGLFTRLVEGGYGFEFFYEVKANLSREQLKRLRDGGVRSIQPGIESLNSHVLKLMRKGVRGIQNVNLLRWSRYYGIDVAWNVLWGFPGEQESDYLEQQALMRKLFHLQPPGAGGRIWMERFSPIFSDREAFPTEYIRPEASYAYVYPGGVDLMQAAYFFDYELHNTLSPEIHEETSRIIRDWKLRRRAKPEPALRYWSAPDYLQIEDVRSVDAPTSHSFQGVMAVVYPQCSERPVTAAQVHERLGSTVTAEETEEALLEFCARDLMMREGNLFLSLAIPAGRPR